MPAPSFDQTINDLIISFSEKIQGGLTFTEAIALGHEFTAACMAAAQQLATEGIDKKTLVLDAVGRLYDNVAPRIKIPVLPYRIDIAIELVRPMIRPAIRVLVLKAAEGTLEGIFRLKFKKPALAA